MNDPPKVVHCSTEYTAMVSMHLEDYLKNAVKINEAIADENRKYDSDILLGYGQTESGEKIPAYFIVSKLTTGQVELVEFSSLYSIRAKKIVEDSAQSSQAFQGPTSTKISISDLLDIVNETYSDILPKTVVEHYGNERRKTKLGESVKVERPAKSGALFNSYGKNYIEGSIKDAFADNRILFVDKKRSLLTVRGERLQLPNSLYGNDFTNNIDNFWANVNYLHGKTKLPEPKKNVYNALGEKLVERPAKSGALFNKYRTHLKGNLYG